MTTLLMNPDVAEFHQRAAKARAVSLNPDLWSAPARDLIRIAAFAGFDANAVVRRCCLRVARRDAWKIHAPTVEAVLAEMAREDQ